VGAVVINDVVGIVVDVNICVVDCNDVTPFVVVDDSAQKKSLKILTRTP
jgi:hypothetical protein